MLVITVPQNGTRLCLRVRGNNKHYLISSKEGRTPKNWCLRTVVLEKAPESPSDSKTKPINLKGDQTRIFTEKTDAEAPVFWSSDVNSWLIGKVPDDGTDWGQKERVSEDQRAGWHHWCNGHELGKTSGDSEGQRGLVCCSPWNCKELDMTGWLNNNDPTIPLPGIYLEKNMVWKDTCTPVFIAVLFTIAKKWKQTKCPSTEEWIKKMCAYIQWNITQASNGMKLCHLRRHGWT